MINIPGLKATRGTSFKLHIRILRRDTVYGIENGKFKFGVVGKGTHVHNNT